MITITLEPFVQEQQNYIGLKFSYHFETKEIIKRLDGVVWSKIHRCYCVIYDREPFNTFKKHLVEKGFVIAD